MSQHLPAQPGRNTRPSAAGSPPSAPPAEAPVSEPCAAVVSLLATPDAPEVIGTVSAGGTRIADDRFNREVLAAVEAYRLAVEKGDAEALFLMASENYSEDSGTAAGEDDYGYDGLKEVLVGRFRMAKDIRYAMKYVTVHSTCAPADDLPVGCVARVEALVDASFTVIDARGQDRRADKRDQNELVLKGVLDRIGRITRTMFSKKYF